MDGHGGPLGEAQHHRALQGHALLQHRQPAPQVVQRPRQLRPARLLQVVPLPPTAGRMGEGGLQGHHAHLGPHEQLAQLKEIARIGTPAMQQHQPLLGLRRAADAGFAESRSIHGGCGVVIGFQDDPTAGAGTLLRRLTG